MIKVSEMPAYEFMTLNQSLHGAVFKHKMPVLYQNFINRHNYTLNICPVTIYTNSFVFYFTQNFYLMQDMNNLIGNFKSAGLIDFIISKYIDPIYVTAFYKKEKQPPTPFEYSRLKGIFKLLFYLLGLSTVTFVSELLFFVLDANVARCKK